jgi:Flp pilus assembly protein TadG
MFGVMWKRGSDIGAGIPAVHRPAGGMARDVSGSVAIVFALTTVIVASAVGAAVDFGRMYAVRQQMQSAVDASVLAAARAWQIESDAGIAETQGRLYYDKNKPRLATSEVSGFTSDTARNAIVIEARAYVSTPFLSIVRGSQTTTLDARAEAMLAVGGNSKTNLEIAMMLDVTGSMSGQKIEDLKTAAKDLVDIVVWSDQSEFTSKVALVPFANGVNLGSTALVNQVRGSVKSGSCTSSSSPCTSYTSSTSPLSSQWTWGAPATWFRFTNTSGSSSTFRASSYCVSERIGADKFTDAAPSAAAAKVGPIYVANSSSESSLCTLVNTSDLEVNAVLPLSNSKTALKGRIDKLALAGTTAGQIGTAWAWYMLAPSWAYLWPAESQPVAYNTENTRKIAILMTDGEYNTAHCNGVLSRNSVNLGTRINCDATNGISDTQADQMCAAMKSGTGITVYTVGFALGGNATAISTLTNCASDPAKFYNAEDGTALRAAFRDIALQIATLRLSQ